MIIGPYASYPKRPKITIDKASAIPKDDSAVRGHTDLIDLACVYKVDECPNCGKKDVEYSDVYEFCNECGYTFN